MKLHPISIAFALIFLSACSAALLALPLAKENTSCPVWLNDSP